MPAKKRDQKGPPSSLRDERRAELVAAAYAMIAEKGLEGIRTRDVAARAGVNISTLHYYFGTKEALLLAVVEHVGTTFARRDAGLAASDETLSEHLRAAWRSFQETPHLAVVLQELVVRAQRDRAARAAFRGLHAFWNRLVEQALQRSIERGQVRRDLDPIAGARIVTSFIIGATAQLGVNPKAFAFHEVARELERLLSPPPRA